MPGETQAASIGYKDEFWLHNGTDLYRLREVKSFDTPVAGAREQVETTSLDAQDWRRTYTSGFYEDTDFTVTLNARFLSDTDLLLTEANADNDVRDFRAVFAEDGVPVAQVDGTSRCTGYTYGTISVGDLKESTATFRVVSVGTIIAYTPEAPEE